jgi:hypothetical protein
MLRGTLFATVDFPRSFALPETTKHDDIDITDKDSISRYACLRWKKPNRGSQLACTNWLPTGALLI